MGRTKIAHKNSAFALAILIFLSTIPSVYAEATITLTAMPTTQEADPGTTAEYTIVVRNTGENDVTVTLSTSQGSECTGYTSTVEQPQGAISSGDSVDVLLSVNLTAQPAESCDTTVTGVATEVGAVPGTSPPTGTADVIVTTTAGEGSGGSTWGVEISTQHPEDKTWNGNDDEVIWPITVENTGRLNATINIDWENPGDCSIHGGSWDIVVDPNQVTLDSGDEEVVTFSISGLDDDDDDMAARLTCYTITATVTNAGLGADEENTTDELDLSLEIPEVKLCSFTTDSVSVNAAPFSSETARFTVTNEGNTDFNVVITTAGNKNSWIQEIEPPNGELSLQQPMVFDVLISPDDSASADTTHSITIRINEQRGGSTGDIICTSTLEVTVGLFRDGEINFVGEVPEIEPGTTGSAQISITNKGNGPGYFEFSILAEEPAGWSSSFYDGGNEEVVSMNSIQLEQDQSITVFVNISVPIDALADDAVIYTVKLMQGNGDLFDQDSTSISVAERHDIDLEVTVNSQSGKDGATVSYPFTVLNPGNVADNYNLGVSKNSCTSSDGANSDWDVRFFEDTPNSVEINMINIPAQTSKNIIAKVTIDGGEKSQCRTTIQVLNTADQINLQESFNITTTSSNLIFRMNAFFENPGDLPNQVESTQPPGGSAEFVFWIQNDGVFYGNPQEDNAVITVRTINGVNYELNINKNGIIYDGSESIPVPMKYVLRDLSTGEFFTNGDGEILEFTDMDDANTTWLAGGLAETHEIMLYALQVTIKLDIDEDVEDGNGGTVYVDVRSEFNAEDIKTLEIVLKIETIHDLKIEAVNGDTQTTELPENAYFELRIYNNGNTNERIVVHISEGLRGWIPLVPETDDLEFTLEPGSFRVITIKVEPPESTLNDEFDFTVSIQPKDATGMIGRENIELKVIGNEPGGFLPSFSFFTSISCILVAAVSNLIYQRRNMKNIPKV
ncbi:MAG: hypothetical protein CMB64_04270 [Euryarchaeota archaeon]|nr:hypothetical protein [Euryarchaeota archaeon]